MIAASGAAPPLIARLSAESPVAVQEPAAVALMNLAMNGTCTHLRACGELFGGLMFVRPRVLQPGSESQLRVLAPYRC